MDAGEFLIAGRARARPNLRSGAGNSSVEDQKVHLKVEKAPRRVAGTGIKYYT